MQLATNLKKYENHLSYYERFTIYIIMMHRNIRFIAAFDFHTGDQMKKKIQSNTESEKFNIVLKNLVRQEKTYIHNKTVNSEI
jgi:hypothetical protein